MPIADADVVVVGAGPTGLMLAGELALARVKVAILERRVNQDLIGMRAGGMHARTIEVFDQRGIADRFLAAGQVAQVAGFAWIRLDIGDFPTRHPYGLALWQNRIERILADWVAGLGVPIHRGCEVTGIAQDEAGVDIDLADGQRVRAAYLAGCDGGRSLIRKSAGIGFPGSEATLSCLIAEIEVGHEPEWGTRRDDKGIHGFSRMAQGGPVRVMVTEQNTGTIAPSGEPNLQDLSNALIAVYGTDYGIHSPVSISRFTDMARQAAAYRERRVFLAGDAAHVHFPVGGQGLNLGVQDAVNLGWKLAQVVKGVSPESLLDTYQGERHPVAARVLRNTMAQTVLLRGGDRVDALRDSVSELLSMEEPRQRFGAMMSGLDIRYDLGEGHALLGRRMPDLDLMTPGGPVRTFTMLHAARPVLVNFAAALDIAPWADRVTRIDATYDGAWELPALGVVPAPAAVLIRPDGYVAWVGEGTDTGLSAALTRWFGPPHRASSTMP